MTLIIQFLPQTTRLNLLPHYLTDIAQQLPIYLLSFPAEHNIGQAYLCADRTLAKHRERMN